MRPATRGANSGLIAVAGFAAAKTC